MDVIPLRRREGGGGRGEKGEGVGWWGGVEGGVVVVGMVLHIWYYSYVVHAGGRPS